MLELNSILTKTRKGVDEIQTRANKLPQKRRSLLIMIDGRLSAGDLVARFPGLNDIQQTLQELADEGYVEVRGREASRPAPAAPVSTPQGQGPTPAELNAAVRALSRTLYDAVGPAADNVTAKLEAARDRDAFMRAWQSCRLMVESTIGKKRTEPLHERAISIAERFFGS